MDSQSSGELGRLIETGVEVTVRVEGELNDAQPRSHADELEAFKEETRFLRTRSIIWGSLVVLFTAGLVFVFAFEEILANWSWSGILPKNPAVAADRVLDISPIIVRRSVLSDGLD